MNTHTQHTPELSFDGCGINGPDQYRTRLATFNREAWDAETVTKYGRLMESAPELLAALQAALPLLPTFGPNRQSNVPVIEAVRAAIAKAEGRAE